MNGYFITCTYGVTAKSTGRRVAAYYEQGRLFCSVGGGVTGYFGGKAMGTCDSNDMIDGLPSKCEL